MRIFLKKHLNKKLFCLQTWKWPNTYTEAETTIHPHDLFEELERLTGFDITEDYYNHVIAKVYKSDTLWTHSSHTPETVMRRRCLVFTKYQDAWILKEQLQCLRQYLEVYYEAPESLHHYLPFMEPHRAPAIPHEVFFPENFNDGDFAADD